MDLTLLHPKIVHLPIALAVLMPLIAGGLVLAWWRGWLPRRVWWIAVLLQGVLVASGFAAMQTGEGDEERVETVLAEHYIEAHEEAAEAFEWAAVALLLLFASGALIPNEKRAKGLAATAAVGTLLVFGLGYRVGEAGGALVYEHGAANAFITAAPAGAGGLPRHLEDRGDGDDDGDHDEHD